MINWKHKPAVWARICTTFPIGYVTWIPPSIRFVTHCRTRPFGEHFFEFYAAISNVNNDTSDVNPTKNYARNSIFRFVIFSNKIVIVYGGSGTVGETMQLRKQHRVLKHHGFQFIVMFMNQIFNTCSLWQVRWGCNRKNRRLIDFSLTLL